MERFAKGIVDGLKKAILQPCGDVFGGRRNNYIRKDLISAINCTRRDFVFVKIR